MRKLSYILVAIFILLAAGACGPKPKVVSENLSKQELKEEPMSQAAFYHYISGVVAELEENYELAINYYKNALRYDPDNYEIRVALANIRMGMREYEVAWKLLEPIEDIYSESVLMKADVQRSLGNWELALKYYELGARLDPTNINPYWYLGNYYRQVGEIDKAIKNYERMVRLNGSTQIINELGELHIQNNDTSKAIETFQRSLRADPSAENKDAYMLLSRVLNAAGKSDSAQAVLQDYIKVAAGSLDARLELIETYIQNEEKEAAVAEIEKIAEEYPNRSRLLGQLGTMAIDLNEAELARRMFNMQAELDPTNFFPYYYLGRIAVFENRLEDAKSNFWKVVDLVDSIPDGWINLAEIYRAQDSLQMSVDIMREGMERVSSGRTELQIYLSRYYAQLEQYQSVVNILEGVVDTSTTDIGALFTLASAYERIGEFDKSVAHFEQILELDQDFHPALNYLGYMYADSGINLARAEDMIERALEKDSLNPAYLDSYGWVMFKLGKLEKAESYIQQAIELMDNPDVELYDHLAEIYQAQGREEEARRTWQKALGVDPDNVAIREKLDR
ncbi:MAG TPA: tetratricopeptide repeat protein [candidate division Zixibacteria bacterium]|nr:tetratricopeptide repeat protein [candidate division Zixibacteria bacterium]